MASDMSPGGRRAHEASERFRASMDGIRSRADATAKIFGGIAGAAIGGLGYARLADFFPYRGPFLGLAAAIGGVALMLVTAGLLIRRFRRASYSVVTSADETKTFTDNEINPTEPKPRLREWLESGRDPVQERKLICGAYQAVAVRNHKTTLADLERTGREEEERAERLAGEDTQEARDTGSEAAIAASADRILAEVQMAQDRAATFLLRRRATQALFGGGAVVLASLFILGWYVTAAGTDAIEAERKDEVELVKSCAETRKAVGFAAVDLPSACGDLATDLSSAERRKATAAAVNDVREACLRDAEGDAAATRECKTIALVKEDEAGTP